MLSDKSPLEVREQRKLAGQLKNGATERGVLLRAIDLRNEQLDDAVPARWKEAVRGGQPFEVRGPLEQELAQMPGVTPELKGVILRQFDVSSRDRTSPPSRTGFVRFLPLSDLGRVALAVEQIKQKNWKGAELQEVVQTERERLSREMEQVDKPSSVVQRAEAFRKAHARGAQGEDYLPNLAALATEVRGIMARFPAEGTPGQARERGQLVKAAIAKRPELGALRVSDVATFAAGSAVLEQRAERKSRLQQELEFTNKAIGQVRKLAGEVEGL